MTKQIEGIAEKREYRIGHILRESQKKRGLTLEDVAIASGITKGFLSSVERDLSSLSVATLLRICEVLNISIGKLFRSNLPMVVRSNEREKFQYGGIGIDYSLLSSRNAANFRAVWGELEPGGHSGQEFHTLDADEVFMFVASGRILLNFEGQEVTLHEGDCATYDPRIPHQYSNPSSKDICRTLCVICPPSVDNP